MQHIPIRHNTTNTEVRADCLKCANWAMIAPSTTGKTPQDLPPIETTYQEVQHAATLHAQQCTGPWQ